MGPRWPHRPEVATRYRVVRRCLRCRALPPAVRALRPVLEKGLAVRGDSRGWRGRGLLALGFLLLLLLVTASECLEENSDEQVHEKVAADDEDENEEAGRGGRACDVGGGTHRVGPPADHHDKDGHHRRPEVVEVEPRDLLRQGTEHELCAGRGTGASCSLAHLATFAAGSRVRRTRVAAVAIFFGKLATEELHAEEGEDGGDEDHEYEEVLELRDCVGERHADRVKPFPRLHQPQHPKQAQHAKDAQEREVRTAAAAHHPEGGQD